jgi:hypothetical protein
LPPPRCRFDLIDCERYTIDENILDANKNSLPEAPDELSGLVEYKVHGMFASRQGARCFPDTFMYSARDLKDAGVSKRRIMQVVIDYHAQLLERGMGALEEVSSDEDEPDERRQEGGQRNAAIQPEPVGISAVLPVTAGVGPA